MPKISTAYILFAIIAIILLLYFVVLPYYNQQTNICLRQPCAINVTTLWNSMNCNHSLEDALILKAHIVTLPNGQLSTFDCQFGKEYHANSNSSIAPLLKCTRENIESIDLAIKGRNVTPHPLVFLDYSYQYDDYNYYLYLCEKKSGERGGLFLVEYNGSFYS